MARQTFRLNLSSSEFPFLSSLYGRSIVYPQQDMHYIRPNAFSGSEADHNIGIPQILFCENVMPASYGYQSIAYSYVFQPSPGVTDFDSAFYLRDAGENRTLFSPGINGTNCKRYTYDPAANQWNISNQVLTVANVKCTVANVKGRTFVHAAFNANFWEWNGAWANVALNGLVAANIQGLVSANAYLIAYDYNTIYWSSTTNVADFVPSIATGAGSERILSNKGRIVWCCPIEDGFIVYTTVNAIIAKYSNNIRFPWIFKEIKNSAGINNQEQASSGGDGLNYYVYSTNGLMTNGPTRSDHAFTTVDEFLGCRQIEVFNYVTRAIEIVNLTDVPIVKVEYIANRYLIISYGNSSGNSVTLTHALVYDSALKRWGKLRTDHVDCFEFFGNPGTPNSTIALTWAQVPGLWSQQNNVWADYGAIIHGGAGSLTVPYRSIGFLQKDGTIKVVNFDRAGTTDDAILLIGRIQFLRDRFWTIQEVDAESVGVEKQTKLSIWSSLDGLTIKTKIYPFKEKRTGNVQKWKMKIAALNHILAFQGNFDLNSVVVRGNLGGKR